MSRKEARSERWAITLTANGETKTHTIRCSIPVTAMGAIAFWLARQFGHYTADEMQELSIETTPLAPIEE